MFINRNNCRIILGAKTIEPDSIEITTHADGLSEYKILFSDLSRLKPTQYRIPTIKNVIFNPPATIVFWDDGLKTVVKCSKNDRFDPEKAIAMAIVKKIYGNVGRYNNDVQKWAKTCGCYSQPLPKKRMTFREEVVMKEPGRIDAACKGGVTGCPKDTKGLACPKAFRQVKNCTECWDREIPDELMED